MMKLTDLDPRWIMKDGKRIGFIFRSPTQRDRHRQYQSCFETPPSHKEQFEMFNDLEQYGATIIQGCNPNARWTIAGGIDTATFETMTVTPSLDGSPGGLWHGFITNGQIVGGI
ncbi:hypothetical protein [Mesorhizobium sp. M6A.T.Ce.TU.016.01.1.1]|uniref:hypothetical protein n=1 Tax=Mesorhizobium sp. M6A.T.Ce.TU.016.01.1.1 TaxID=2496783 RepID=UPI000FCC5AA8|nr:hypothetical protein [Mesorhizobium sp. M6A.T.Ce.TU.016.01.1.1]RUU29780.1 hypothetical protein EOC94_13005 [Mesorhizobium sp. M6A.T.Ce.TU.016.01.1.1]